MTDPQPSQVLEARIGEWRVYLLRRQAIESPDVDELEDHLRSQVADLQTAGLDDEEAFLIGVRRIGQLDALSREFAREHSERLWKHLVVNDPGAADAHPDRKPWIALALAMAAAIAIKVPELFGIHWGGENESMLFYARNLSLFVLPFMAAFFTWQRPPQKETALIMAAPFIAGALAANFIPFKPGGNTELLAILHLPIAMWLGAGVAYAGGDWRGHHRRMDYVRFTGEWFIYFVLIALGGGVLMGTTMFVFTAIGLDPQPFVVSWVLPCGAAGAVIIAAWLVGAKQSVIENMAPVLTLLFTPLFTLMLLAFLVTVAWTGSGVDVSREVLIGFDLMLVLVVGLLLYAISARDPHKPPGLFDALQLLLVVSALLVDALALWAILARITEFGFTPNRVAALGENLILVANLGGSAFLYANFLRGRGAFEALARWQTAFLPVYAAWAAVVVVIFPLVFGYR